MIRNIALISCSVMMIISFPGYTHAEQAPLTVPDLVERALERSAAIRAAGKNTLAASMERTQARAWNNPSIGVEGGIKNSEGKTGPAYNLSISQPISLPGKIQARDSLKAVDEKLAGLDRDEAELFVRYTVIRLAVRYAACLEMEKHLTERIDRFTLIRKYLSGRPFPSPKKRMEKHMVEMRLDLLQKDMAVLKEIHTRLWNDLNLYTALDGPVSLDVPLFHKALILDRESIMRSVEKGNIDTRKRSLLVERIAREAVLARRESLPDLSLSMRYGEERAQGTDRSACAGLTLTLPVLNTNAGAIKALEAREDAGRILAEQGLMETRSAMDSLFASYETAGLIMETLPPSKLEEVHLRMADADAAFTTDQIDLATYFELESEVYEIHAAVFEAQSAYMDRLTEIMVLQGNNDCPLFPTLKAEGGGHVR